MKPVITTFLIFLTTSLSASSLTERFYVIDTNNDYKVSLKEYKAYIGASKWKERHLARFRRLDRNKDGFVTEREIKGPR